ncbi:PIG-L family deacetylase [Actinocorallia longicatena]|uniref:GlcNAc-PI de-N-acetylase n=1 Tax=Actinocorallia longicatena TaxID=111803 RepID=A0ABP6QG03_9ACTN
MHRLRRRTAFALSLTLSSVLSVTRLDAIHATARPRAERPRPAHAVRYMQVVAHPDDDLLFMNPDLSRVLASGDPAVTVFTTAGQKTGAGTTGAERARNRQRGILNAYAAMADAADGDRDSQREWAYELLTLGVHQVERYRLRARPEIQVVFAGLPDGGMHGLVQGADLLSVIPAGRPVTATRYLRADAVGLLRTLMLRYRPTVLRVQDVRPEGRDHADHVTTARLATEAAAGIVPVVLGYRAYNIRLAPPNLSEAEAARKLAVFDEYRHREPDGSFRYHAFSNQLEKYTRRMYPRSPLGTGWAARQDGMITLYRVVGGSVRVVRRIGEGWASLDLPPGGGALAPGVTADEQGVLGVRLDDHHVVRWDGASWHDLGCPGGRRPELTGTPLAAGPDVYVRDGDGGVSVLRGGETRWRRLGGRFVQDGLATDGSAVYASTRATRNGPPARLLRYAGGRVVALAASPSGPPTVASGGRVVFRGRGGLSSLTGDLGGGGSGQAAAAGALLFERDASGGVSVHGEEGWTSLGGTIVDSPSAVRDGSSFWVFGLGADGRIWARHGLSPWESPA